MTNPCLPTSETTHGPCLTRDEKYMNSKATSSRIAGQLYTCGMGIEKASIEADRPQTTNTERMPKPSSKRWPTSVFPNPTLGDSRVADTTAIGGRQTFVPDLRTDGQSQNKDLQHMIEGWPAGTRTTRRAATTILDFGRHASSKAHGRKNTHNHANSQKSKHVQQSLKASAKTMKNSLKTHDMDQRCCTKRHMKAIEMETQNLTAQI